MDLLLLLQSPGDLLALEPRLLRELGMEMPALRTNELQLRTREPIPKTKGIDSPKKIWLEEYEVGTESQRLQQEETL